MVLIDAKSYLLLFMINIYNNIRLFPLQRASMAFVVWSILFYIVIYKSIKIFIRYFFCPRVQKPFSTNNFWKRLFLIFFSEVLGRVCGPFPIPDILIQMIISGSGNKASSEVERLEKLFDYLLLSFELITLMIRHFTLPIRFITTFMFSHVILSLSFTLFTIIWYDLASCFLCTLLIIVIIYF